MLIKVWFSQLPHEDIKRKSLKAFVNMFQGFVFLILKGSYACKLFLHNKCLTDATTTGAVWMVVCNHLLKTMLILESDSCLKLLHV